MGTGSFPGVKRLGCCVNHPPTSSAEVKRVYSYTSTPLWAFESVTGYLYLYLNCCDVTSKETTIKSSLAIRPTGFYWILLLQKLTDQYLRKFRCTIVIKMKNDFEMAIYFHQYYLTPFSDLLIDMSIFPCQYIDTIWDQWFVNPDI
jgi:hypothetical protein